MKFNSSKQSGNDFASDTKSLHNLVQNERVMKSMQFDNVSECITTANNFPQYDSSSQLNELKLMNNNNNIRKMNNSRPPSNDAAHVSVSNNQASLEAMYLTQMKPNENVIKEEKQNDNIKKEIKVEKSSRDCIKDEMDLISESKVINENIAGEKNELKDANSNASPSSAYAKNEPDCGSKSEPN